MKQVNNDNLNSNGLTRPLDEVAPDDPPANRRCSASAGSEYPLPWEVFSSRPRNATVYAANSEPICFMSGKDAAIKANLIVKLVNQNSKLSRD